MRRLRPDNEEISDLLERIADLLEAQEAKGGENVPGRRARCAMLKVVHESLLVGASVGRGQLTRTVEASRVASHARSERGQ